MEKFQVVNFEFLEVATQAALEGGEVLKKYWGHLSHVREKSIEGDLVTEADQESEDVIIDLLSKNFPSHKILSEESGIHEAKNQDYLWVIDPLDGTTNYTHQFPMVAVSIALFYQDKPLIGVVYNPILNELFQGVKGQGATLNQEFIHVSTVSQLKKSLLATGFAYDRRETKDNNYAEFCHLTNSCQGVRRAGSAALDLSYVACGRLDGHWEIGLRPWDVAAGALLVEEAGGKVSGFDTQELDIYARVILATNGEIHEQIRAELHQVRSR
ncbi:MAG: Inositol-1-monophosphatase [Chlamydiae bacterium]|nr:Inositol-1-monophosphatase [Chlamydiota bacterium]